ncbi:MAG TPA: benzoate-CoA ligase family protein [Gemmatimonadota bacterium]|nr:benzoate-CoA ligase family protein [Gemmatimonadota bacterium]
MSFTPPESFNISDYFLDDRIREGRGDRVALRTRAGDLSYAEVQAMAARFAHVLKDAGVEPEQRVLLALSDRPELVAALFGTLKIGAVVVMVNPALPTESMRGFLDYTRAKVAVVDSTAAASVRGAAAGARHLRHLLDLDEPALADLLDRSPAEIENFPSHRDDPAIWLFSGGTTGMPKAVVQPHASYANSTELYAKGVLGIGEDDITLSVPKLYFGYAMGSNLLFPFSVGGSAVLFPEPATVEAVFEAIERYRPTILVTVPKMVHLMVDHPDAGGRDLSSLRLATSAGEALPVELHRRWDAAFEVELLDGLGTAEMWHIFLTNRPGRVRRGTLGEPVPGFDVEIRDEGGRPVRDGEVGWLWVRGASRAIAYWQRMEATREAFRGEWYVTGDMMRRLPDGYFAYCGRGDDMLKVSGKWLAPKEVENCLLKHPAVREAAVVGARDGAGLTKPCAFVVAEGAGEGLARELQTFVREALEPNKAPREVLFLEALPRTHLGKVDRGLLRERAEAVLGGKA